MAPRPQINSQKDAGALPAKLLQIIPNCAQDCVNTAVNTSFVPSKCNNASDAGCICSHYSASGYTLGELAFSCLYANCPQSIRDESRSTVFDVCSSYPSAVAATHSVLTLTTMGSTPSTSSTSPPSTTAQTTATSLQSSSATSASESQASQTTFARTTTTTSSSSSTSTTQSATATTQHPQSLSTGQAVGISVASIAIAGLLVGLLLFCCCCIRRRRKDKAETPNKKSMKSMKSRHSFDFVDRSLPPSPVRPPPRPAARPQQEWWRYTSGPVHPEINRVADDSRSHRASIIQDVPAVYMSNNSDKRRQVKETQQKPFRIPAPALGMSDNNKRYRPDSTNTTRTVFEEEDKPLFERKALPKPPSVPRPVLLIPKSSTPSLPTYADHYTMSPEDASKTGLGLQIPSQTYELPTAKTLKLSEGISKVVHIPMPPPSSASTYIPAYYTSNDSRTPVVPKWSPGDNFSQPDLIPKPLGPRGLRSSWASATTFESVDPDETTPENEVDKQLSPVSYPKVPRPSNQAIPRSPRSTMSPVPGRFNPNIKRSRTLFTKRRGSGEDMSIKLAGGTTRRNGREDDEQFLLGKTPDSPLALKGYGRTIQNPTMGAQKETPQMELKSPLWEPKLTPSRRGDDLFISVELKGRR